MESHTLYLTLEERARSAAEDAPPAPLVVGVVGAPPPWLADEAAAAALGRTEIVEIEPGSRGPATEPPPRVLHASGAEGERLLRARGRGGPAIVVDLTGEDATRLGRRRANRLAAADAVLVGSLAELREIRRRFPLLAPKTALFRAPLDLARFGPRELLLETERRDFLRFCRFHRLGEPTILFAGPFTEAGGLDLALEAFARLREREPEARLAAIPLGEIDRRYLDRCERRALAFGHRAVVEWSAAERELPYWFGAAQVVCAPQREALPSVAPRLAAAAGCAAVVSDTETLLEHVVDGETAYVVPRGDVDVLHAALEALVGDAEERSRMAAAAAARASIEPRPADGARELRRIWEDAAERRAPGGVPAAARPAFSRAP